MLSLDLIYILAIGLFAGFIDAIAGGGGLLTMPALLTTGIPPHTVLGTNKMASTMGTINSTRIYLKQNIYHPKLWTAAIVAVFLGAAFGALATQLFSNDEIAKIVPIVLVIVACYMLVPKPKHLYQRLTHFKPKRLSSTITGGILGFYDGFIGPGTGTFWTSALIRLYKMDILQATAIAKLMNMTSNTVGLLTFMLLSHVDYRLGLTMGCAIMVGAYLGAHSALRFGGHYIKCIFLFTVILMAVYLIWVQYF